MSEDIVALLRENVIQGRRTKDDEGIEEDMIGTPGVLELTQLALEKKILPETIITSGLTAGMEIVGEKFNTKEYFIPDMLASAEAVGAAMNILKPHLEASNIENKGKFAIATVKGDIHDIGKNIVAILLKGAGYEVSDLGIDVPTEKIVETVRENKQGFSGVPQILDSPIKTKKDWYYFKEKFTLGKHRLFAHKDHLDVDCIAGWDELLAQQKIDRKQGRATYFFGIIGYDALQHYVGSERLLMSTMTDPGWVSEMVVFMVEWFIEIYNFVTKKGLKIDGVFPGNDLGQKPFCQVSNRKLGQLSFKWDNAENLDSKGNHVFQMCRLVVLEIADLVDNHACEIYATEVNVALHECYVVDDGTLTTTGDHHKAGTQVLGQGHRVKVD